MPRILLFHECDAEQFSFGETIEGTRYFEAVVDELPGAVTALRLARPDLQRFQPHPEHVGAFVDAFVPTLRRGGADGAWVYDIEVRYRSDLGQQDPLDEPAVFDWSSQIITLPVFEDESGEPIVTTAGEPILGITEEFALWTAEVTKNIPRAPQWLKSYGNAINSDRVQLDGETFEAETLKTGELSITRAESNDVEYRVLKLKITHNPLGWARVFPNAGFYELNTIVERGRRREVLKRMTDSLGQAVTSPKFLDANGRRPRDKQGNVREQLDKEDLIFLKKFTKKRLPFSALPLR